VIKAYTSLKKTAINTAVKKVFLIHPQLSIFTLCRKWDHHSKSREY